MAILFLTEEKFDMDLIVEVEEVEDPIMIKDTTAEVVIEEV